ncbi:MAG: tetratricopeptide repeat protein [Planctomycetota bacterium]
MRFCFLLLIVVSCGGVAPRPEDIAAREPVPAVSIAAQQDGAVLADQAWQHGRAGDWAEARQVAETALALDPRSARAHAVLGRCLMEEAAAQQPPELADWRRAEGELRLAARLAPDDVEIAILLGEFLQADGHLAAATEVLASALDREPDHVGCLAAAARLHFELAEERAALPLLRRLRQLRPDDRESLLRLAHCELALARTERRLPGGGPNAVAGLERAAAAFSAYRRAVPEDAAGWVGEGFARLTLWREAGADPSAADLAEVEALFEGASDRWSSSPEPEFNLGVVRELRNDAPGARDAYGRALERDPEHLPALLNLAASLADAGRETEAEDFARRALALSPSDSEAGQLRAFLASRAAGQ